MVEVNFKFFLIYSFFFLIIFGRVLVDPACASLPWQDHKIRVSVYVVALDGVEAREVANVTRVVEGVRGAVEALNKNNLTIELPFLRYWKNFSKYFLHKGEGAPPFDDMTYVYASFPANASLHIINEWDDYRNVVEHSVETIIVNAHGAVLPVPNGYTKEAWTDKIAEAMLLRNVTWVHVGGYPFYYYQKQGSSLETWGEDGLKQLMAHVGKPNTTCYYYGAWQCDGMEGGTDIMDATWFITQAYFVPRFWPLNYTEFEGLIAVPIWGVEYQTGAAVAFKKDLNQASFGFYVHIGTNKTYSEGGDETDSDYSRGYIGAAVSLYCLVSRTARETMLLEAQALIDNAQKEGRTLGLNEAYALLEEAKYFDRHSYGPLEFWDAIYKCMFAAINAEKPAPRPIAQDVAIIVAAVTGSTVIGVFWYRRNKNKGDERNLEN